jgi:probable selenium-dependent hydroxylase accessory protein YqeC
MNDFLKGYSLREALALQPRELIALVGAGGKTTLMFRLAKEFLLHAQKVITTTTTKIFEPSQEETPWLLVEREEKRIKRQLAPLLEKYHHLTLAAERVGSGKLAGFPPDVIDRLWQDHEIDGVIVEADGAKRRPLKAPREGEPVIPSRSTLIIGLLGLDGLDKELNEENAFQVDRLSRLTGTPRGERISEETFIHLALHPEGLFKGSPSEARRVVLLNQVDLLKEKERAIRLGQRILEEGSPKIERILLGQLQKEPPVLEVIGG